MESRTPRFSAEAHLAELLGDGEGPETGAGAEIPEPPTGTGLGILPTAEEPEIRAKNDRKEDWISGHGRRPERAVVRHG